MTVTLDSLHSRYFVYAAQALTEKLLSIEYMDVAEQSIAALAKISVQYPQVSQVNQPNKCP